MGIYIKAYRGMHFHNFGSGGCVGAYDQDFQA